jgi:hypothetical protein
MTKISEYPIITNPTEDDILIGTDVNSSDVTKNFSIGSIVNLVGNGGRPYNVYTALLTQSGTSAPVATVLENTLGATITWSYVGVGQYYATASSAVFTASKTTGILSNSSSTGINAFVNISTTVFNTVTTSSGVAANNELLKNMVEIRVYN